MIQNRLNNWNNYFQRRKPVFFFGLIILVGCLVYISFKIKFDEDISGFLPHSKETELINFVYENNKISDKIIISLSLQESQTDETALMDGIDQLSGLLRASTQNFYSELIYQIDDQSISDVQESILSNLPLYMTDQDYQRLDTLIQDSTISRIMSKNKDFLLMPSGGFMRQNITSDPLHLSGNVFKSLQKMGEFQNFQSKDGYLFSKDSKQIFLFIVAKNAISETKNNALFVKKIEETFKQFNQSTQNKYKITYFGAIPVSVANAKQIKSDSIISMVIALLLIIIILSIYFKKITHLILIIIPVLFGALLSIAFIVFFKGGISTIAIGASSAIFGIALNYSLHFLIHYKETQSLTKTIQDIAFPMIVGSITTVGAFLSLLFVKSAALKDFGIFSAFTLVGTLIFVLAILPQFFRKRSQHNNDQEIEEESNFWTRIASAKLENIPFIGLILFILTAIFGYFAGSVKFDTDFSHLSYMTKDQKKALEQISEVAHINTPYLYHISYGKTLEEALIHYEQAFPVLDSMSHAGCFKIIQGIGNFYHSNAYQNKKSTQWNQFWSQHGKETRYKIAKESDRLGIYSESFNPFFKIIDSTYQVDLIKQESIKKTLLNDYIIETPERCVIVSLLYPENRVETIIKSPLAHIPGTTMFNRTMSNESMVTLLYDDFNKVLLMCALLVSFFLIISFGRIELALISLLPMILGWIWILGMMSIFNIQFNIVNIILATFIFGLGDDYSIFMMEGLIQEYSLKKKLVVSYKTAVILSAVTMFIGLGTLIFSKHPAMRSLAEVSTIGMISVVLMSYTVSPYFFKGLIFKKGKPRTQPITLIEYLITIYSFFWFILGCIFLNIIIPFFLIPFAPLAKRKHWYHQIFSGISGFCTKKIPFVKYKVFGFDPKKFEKPCIIIANHQSHIDLTGILGLHPNIIALTNKWAWNLPFYALPLRFADFYPISDNIESSVDQLSKIVEKGYSILIFPEGTRSETCDIQRFHKGAFYLAEKLQLDILPITLHGFGHILPKKEMCLRKGFISLHVGELIRYSEYIKWDGYRNVSKKIRKDFIQNYTQIQEYKETPEYWADKVIKHYLYKGYSIENTVRKHFKSNNNYFELINSIKKYKTIKFINCGYGELPFLASLVLPKSIIFAYESEVDLINIAKNCINIPANLKYEENTEMEFDIIIDVQKI